MKSIDILNLDLRSLVTFLAVLDEGSVSRAAVRLGVSQSAVSHTLDRLRQAFGDPLFVKSGRGIVPTDYALRTGPHIRQLLDDVRTLPSGPPFDPATAEFTFTIAANDYQRDLLLPGLAAILREQAPGIHLQVIPSGIPNADLLRKEACDLVISPFAPEATDIMQRGLMRDFEYVPLPFQYNPFTLLMLWHRRHQTDGPAFRRSPSLDPPSMPPSS